MAGGGYRFRWGRVFLMYGYLDFQQGDGSFVRELDIAGPTVGVSFRF